MKLDLIINSNNFVCHLDKSKKIGSSTHSTGAPVGALPSMLISANKLRLLPNAKIYLNKYDHFALNVAKWPGCDICRTSVVLIKSSLLIFINEEVSKVFRNFIGKSLWFHF